MSDITIIISEHESISIDRNDEGHIALSSLLCRDDYSPRKPNMCLGLDWENRSRTSIKAGYYVGMQWLKDGNNAIYVKPKIENLDFMSMFMHCFDNECRDVANELGSIYHINFDEPRIFIDSIKFELTPMLIVHFLKLMQQIVQRGFKRDYIQIEENLSAKIKGKLLLNQTIKRNYSAGRTDRSVCRYQNYSVDCIENRVLKCTLQFVNKFIKTNSISCGKELEERTNYCLGAFSEVSDKVSVQQIKQFKINPMYKEYASALKIAKIILRRFSYSIDNISKDADKSLPPFWINMPLLFELYVYSQLKAKYHKEISYHLQTFGNEIDFVKYNEKLIIDAKYIPKWDEVVNHQNVRQLSGYARNVRLRAKILKQNGDDTTILPCLIIYPGITDSKEFAENSILDNASPIDTYLHFHKLAIKLPVR